jgi:hypothetical protein
MVGAVPVIAIESAKPGLLPNFSIVIPLLFAEPSIQRNPTGHAKTN